MRLGRIPGARRVPAYLRAVEDDVVLFDSWAGRVSDNPRAISEALHRRGSPLRQIWVRTAGAPAPAWASGVTPGTTSHLTALGSAGWIVANNTLPGFWRKDRRTTYVQTWHGTPLKRIAFDIPHDTTRRHRRYLAHLRREVAEWDHLVSPNAFSTEVLRHAFRYEGTVLETGYPRNDVLSTDAMPALRADARGALGIGADDLVVLYAPTLRTIGSFELALDVGRLADALGEHGHVLLRLHHLVAAHVGEDPHPRVHDVSSRPEDIQDLFPAADVLITDYSSVMFDFAVTRRPMLFFTYDLEHYRDALRGFYFDFEREAPGPLLQDTDEVIDRLRDIPAMARDHARAYDAFVERFCHLDDGHAADRVIDAVFGAAGGARAGDGTGGGTSRYANRPRTGRPHSG